MDSNRNRIQSRQFLADHVARWGGLASRSDFAGREDLWDNLVAFEEFFYTERDMTSIRVGNQRFPIGMVNIGYVANTDVNALAFAREGKEFIAMFSGTAMRLLDVSMGMLAHPKILSEIGSANVEALTNEGLNRVVHGTEGISSLNPQSQERRDFAFAMAVIGSHYIFSHELSHLVMGHAAYVSSKSTGKEVFLEYSESDGARREHDKQMSWHMEFEADTSAVELSLSFVLDVLPKVELDPFKVEGKSAADLMLLWAMSIGMVYTVLHHSHPRSRLHPPPILRYLSAMMVAGAMTAEFWSDIRDEYLISTGLAHQELKLLWQIARTESRVVRCMKALGWRQSLDSIVRMGDVGLEKEEILKTLAYERAFRIKREQELHT